MSVRDRETPPVRVVFGDRPEPDGETLALLAASVDRPMRDGLIRSAQEAARIMRCNNERMRHDEVRMFARLADAFEDLARDLDGSPEAAAILEGGAGQRQSWRSLAIAEAEADFRDEMLGLHGPVDGPREASRVIAARRAERADEKRAAARRAERAERAATRKAAIERQRRRMAERRAERAAQRAEQQKKSRQTKGAA